MYISYIHLTVDKKIISNENMNSKRTGKICLSFFLFSGVCFFCEVIHTTVSHKFLRDIELTLDLDYVQSKAVMQLK